MRHPQCCTLDWIGSRNSPDSKLGKRHLILTSSSSSPLPHLYLILTSSSQGSGFTNGGDPASDTFCPSESDTTLQNGDQWFFDPTSGIRTLAELQDVYHDTVGHSAFLMMDFAPTPEGIIAPDQMARCELQLQLN